MKSKQESDNTNNPNNKRKGGDGQNRRRGSGNRNRGRNNNNNNNSNRRPRHDQRNHKPQAPAEKIPTLEELGSIKMYGDQVGDGAIQLSFTLPMPKCDEARVAAQQFAEKMGLKKVNVLHMEAIDPFYTFFVVYAQSDIEVDVSKIEVPKLEHPIYSFDEVNKILREDVGRSLVVIGACIGTDAHTVGIDAIFNMKGYLGEYGLERYPMLDAINLRAQVDVNELAKMVVEKQADAVLVSRVVTQRDSHIEEFKKFLAALDEMEGVPENLIKICGGPRITHQQAQELGYDAGFGPGTLPNQVASYIADIMVDRLGNQKSDDVQNEEETEEKKLA